jgi:hypothetical protein
VGIAKYGDFLLTGLISEVGPEIIRGALVELLSSTTVAQATEWVEKDYVLWDKIPEEVKEKLHRFSHRLGDISWLTTEWAIDAMRNDLPALASLFLGWKKANNWLSRQVVIIHREFDHQ